MTFPRVHLASVMLFVAALALDLGVVRALSDGPWKGLLFMALPTMNLLAAVGYAGLRRARLRAFDSGFVATGCLSLLTFDLWEQRNPWTFLRYAEPASQAIDDYATAVFPSWHVAVVYTILTLALLAAH